MSAVALPLATIDLLVKAIKPTEPWAYHPRSPGWLVLSVAVLAGLVVISRIPSLFVAVTSGVLAAGVLGNGLSAAWNGLEVPNPLVVSTPTAMIAFNLADVWAISGIIALGLVIGVWLIRNRHLLPPDSKARSRRSGSFPHGFDKRNR